MGSAAYRRIAEFARQGNVVVMAGAGVSAGRPTALPGWKPLNAAILQALRHRLESSLERPNWLAQVIPLVDAQRDSNYFPPEYQAQIIEEMCGERYFHALQALDIDIVNAAHDGIAALAASGALKAIVTTNFDQLIERALDQHGVRYVVGYDNAGFVEIDKRLRTGDGQLLPIIKIHGCVSNHLSMIDTLKQRKRGRSEHLEVCLSSLHPSYWLYLGFSAADLDGNSSYLGLMSGAAHSAGATYIAYPPNPGLGRGAQALMSAYGDRGEKIVSDIADYLRQVCNILGISGPASIPADIELGPTLFHKKFTDWADALAPAAAGLCLAAILEAVGQAEPAARLLDRLVRKEFYDESSTADFQALQLHYGRLGIAWGRFVAVPDINGRESNASYEAMQSLARVSNSEVGYPASTWLACGWLWMNRGDYAMSIAFSVMKDFPNGSRKTPAPQTDEEVVDAWLSSAQVCLVNMHPHTLNLVVDTAEVALARARTSGDVVRTARVAAVQLLALAETTEDIRLLAEQHNNDFAEAERVGDGFALGMRSLALGRWHVGDGGLALAGSIGGKVVAQQGLEHLEKAVALFRNQGMDPWVVFVFLQAARAYANLAQFDDAQACINEVAANVNRFPVFNSYLYQTIGQINLMNGDPQAMDFFRAAVQAAEESGLLGWRDTLRLAYKVQDK